ncbi:hypothetical protein ENUP19_0257G0006 [Entamoeba nuttalli]|uniref:Uncharacterized protein n=1 Tax=Entamoeba nuttalli TaxID=412467 RepID=A0ABQ0DRV0_9EUKA
MILYYVFALETSESDNSNDDYTNLITIIVMSVVFGSLIIVSIFVAIVLIVKQRKTKTDEYHSLD